MKRKHLVPSLLLLTLPLLAPASPAFAEGEEVIKAAGTVTVQGDCRILTDPNGRKFNLVGKLEAANGEMIRVTGKKAERTACLDGPAIQVEKVEKAKIVQGPQAGEPGKGQPVVQIETAPEGTGNLGDKPLADGEVRMLRMRGLLNDEVKVKGCQGFRNLRGELWALTGELKSFKIGDRVQLEGAQVPTKECGIPTLKVTTIETAPAQ